MDHAEQTRFLNAVLHLEVGETYIVREKHLWPCRAHRYDGGWMILLDDAQDRAGIHRALIGWHIRCPLVLLAFLVNDLGTEINRYTLIGDCA